MATDAERREDISPKLEVGQVLSSVPMGEMIQSVALGIAAGQWELDKSSMTVSELMSGQRMVRDLDTGRLFFDENGKPLVVDSRVFFGYTYGRDAQNRIVRTPQKVSMMELGFTPTFYQFVDTIIEIKVSITMTGSQEAQTQDKTTENQATASASNSSSRSGCWWHGHSSSAASRSTTARTQSVDARFSSTYSYSIEGSSMVRTKLVPVPPPAILEERIRQVMEDEEMYRNWLMIGAITNDGTIKNQEAIAASATARTQLDEPAAAEKSK